MTWMASGPGGLWNWDNKNLPCIVNFTFYIDDDDDGICFSGKYKDGAAAGHSVKIEGLRQKKLYNGFYGKYLLSHVWRDDFR